MLPSTVTLSARVPDATDSTYVSPPGYSRSGRRHCSHFSCAFGHQCCSVTLGNMAIRMLARSGVNALSAGQVVRRNNPLLLARQLATASRRVRAQVQPGVSTPVDDPAHSIFAGGAPTTPTSVDSLLDRELDSTFVELCGGRIVREVLLRHNVEKVFGYPGGAVLPVFDIVFGCPAFDFIIPRHEQGAGHMAQGYARVSGKPGVVLVTSGPGATNMITPMQDALADGIPLVVLCGQVPTVAFGTDAFQEADIVSLSQACTKWNYMVDDIADLPRRLKQAFEIATSGRPGPVLVGIPKDIGNSILRRALPRSHITPELSMPRPLDGPASLAVPTARPATTIANDEKLQAAAAMISAAERPVIYAGHGVLTSPDGPELLRRLAHEANIPVTTTMHGLGAFDELDDKHALHMLGMHGSAYANLAMQKADVIIALGARFDDRITGHVGSFAPAARSASAAGRGGIIHFEIGPRTSIRLSPPTSRSRATSPTRCAGCSRSSPKNPTSAQAGSPKPNNGSATILSSTTRLRPMIRPRSSRRKSSRAWTSGVRSTEKRTWWSRPESDSIRCGLVSTTGGATRGL